MVPIVAHGGRPPQTREETSPHLKVIFTIGKSDVPPGAAPRRRDFMSWAGKFG